MVKLMISAKERRIPTPVHSGEFTGIGIPLSLLE